MIDRIADSIVEFPLTVRGWWNRIDHVVHAKLLRGCSRDCALCAVGVVQNWHYERCPTCRDTADVCAVGQQLMELESQILAEVIPEEPV